MQPFNTIGEVFKLTVLGSSHGEYVGGLLEGCPVGMKVDKELLSKDLERRKPGQYGTKRKEEDKVVFEQGVDEKGKTVASTIRFIIRNTDVRKEDYDKFKDYFRPSHVDYVYYEKYGEDILRYKDEASARMFLPCVVAGSLAKMFLKKYGYQIRAEVETIGKYQYPQERDEIARELENLKGTDTVGGKVSCRIQHPHISLGEPIFYKTQAMLAKAMMSIPSAVSFEIGDGIKRTERRGNQDIDQWTGKKTNNVLETSTNHCGGINGGITNGNDIVFYVGFHPVYTLPATMKLINKDCGIKTIKIEGRHDLAHVLRCPIIVENLSAMVMLDLLLMNNKYKIDTYEQ